MVGLIPPGAFKIKKEKKISYDCCFPTGPISYKFKIKFKVKIKFNSIQDLGIQLFLEIKKLYDLFNCQTTKNLISFWSSEITLNFLTWIGLKLILILKEKNGPVVFWMQNSLIIPRS